MKTSETNAITDDRQSEQVEINSAYSNKTEKLEELKQDVDSITELKTDVPNVDKFVKAGTEFLILNLCN